MNTFLLRSEADKKKNKEKKPQTKLPLFKVFSMPCVKMKEQQVQGPQERVKLTSFAINRITEKTQK